MEDEWDEALLPFSIFNHHSSFPEKLGSSSDIPAIRISTKDRIGMRGSAADRLKKRPTGSTVPDHAYHDK